MNNIAYYIISDGIGGAENVVIQTIHKLQQTNSIYLITNNEIAPHFKSLLPQSNILNIGDVYIHTNIKYQKIKYLINNRFYNVRKLIIKRKTASIVKFLHLNKIGVIHCHLDYALLSGFILKKQIPGLKLIYTVHGAFGLLNDKKLKPDIPVSNFDFTKIDKTIFVAKYLENIFKINNIKLGPHTVLYNGIEMIQNENSFCYDNNNVFNILFVGGCKYVKGYDIIVDVATLLIQQNVNFVFNILGNVPEDSEFFKLVSSKNLTEHFKFHGFVYPPLHLEHFKNNHVLLMPSRSEALPIAAIEAISIYLPVIASNVGGVCEILCNNKNGIICNIDASAFYERLIHLKNNYNSIIQNYNIFNKTHRRVFNIDTITKELIKLYKT